MYGERIIKIVSTIQARTINVFKKRTTEVNLRQGNQFLNVQMPLSSVMKMGEIEKTSFNGFKINLKEGPVCWLPLAAQFNRKSVIGERRQLLVASKRTQLN